MTLEHKVDSLESRVHRLEVQLAPAGPGLLASFFERLNQISHKQFLRGLGIFVVVISALALWVSWLNGEIVTTLPLFWLLFGLYLALREASFFTVSDSTRILLLEARSGKAPPSARLHQAKGFGVEAFWQLTLTLFGAVVLALAAAYFGLTYLSDPNWQLTFFFLLMVGVFGYALRSRARGLVYLTGLVSYAILAISPISNLSLAVTALLSFSLVYYAWLDEHWLLLLIAALGGYGAMAHWLTVGLPDPSTQASLLTLLFSFSLLVLLPFVIRRRQASERQLVRLIFGLNGLLFFLVSCWLTTRYLGGFSLQLFLDETLFSGALAAVAWLSYGRFSYAKYFAIQALTWLVLLVSWRAGLVLATGLLATLSFTILAAGFVYQSYTFRQVGLFFLLLTLYLYLTRILEAPSSLSPIIGQDRFWLGVILALLMAAAGQWWRTLVRKEQDYRYSRLISSALFVGSFGVLFLLITELVADPWRAPLWVIVSLAGFFLATAEESFSLRLVSLFAGALSLLKFFLIDSLSFSSDGRLASLLLSGMLLLALAYQLSRDPKFFRKTFDL